MEPQQTQRSGPAPANELKYFWLPAQTAYEAACANYPVILDMHRGANTLSYAQLAAKLRTGEFEIIAFDTHTSPAVAFLVTWGESNGQKLCQIVTITGAIVEHGVVLDCFEAAVRQRGGKVILSVGRRAYKHIVERHGYTVDECILMRKELS